jgi:MFS family permease
MTSYWSIGLLVGIIAPLLGGFIFSHFGLPFFMLAAVVLLCCTFILTSFVKKNVYLYGVKEIFTHIRSFRIIVMIDGALTTASNILLTLYLLTFVRGAFDFGLLLSFIALVSVSFSFLLAKISDRYKKRLEFIWPLSTFSGFIMILFYFSHSFWSAVVLVILFKFVSTILNPIQSNIVFDRPKTTAITWISRELFLNIGRVVFLLLLAFLAFFGFLKESFIVLGLLFIVFPFIVYKKGVYKKYK